MFIPVLLEWSKVERVDAISKLVTQGDRRQKVRDLTSATALLLISLEVVQSSIHISHLGRVDFIRISLSSLEYVTFGRKVTQYPFLHPSSPSNTPSSKTPVRPSLCPSCPRRPTQNPKSSSSTSAGSASSPPSAPSSTTKSPTASRQAT